MKETDEGFQAGLMMDSPLTLTAILRRAAQFFPEKEIVSRLNDGSIHRHTYGDLYRRVVRLMHALRALGVQPGDRVATFAWNSFRHLELYTLKSQGPLARSIPPPSDCCGRRRLAARSA